MWHSKLKVKYKKHTKDPKQYYLKEPLVWNDISVSKGFITDFASTPKWIHWLFPPQGKYSKASIVHDFMYSVNWYTRKEADETFKDIMRHDGTSKATSYIFYLSVRLFGGKHYGS